MGKSERRPLTYLELTEFVALYYIGHASFLLCYYLSEDLYPLVIDPYPYGVFGGALNLQPINLTIDNLVLNHISTLPTATSVLISHNHDDHNALSALPNGVLYDENSSFPWLVERFQAAHDEFDGKKRGGHVDLLKISFSFQKRNNFSSGHSPRTLFSLLHTSDLGETLTPDLIEKIGKIDLLILPIGGYYTVGYAQARELIEQLQPKWVIPMHYLHEGGKLPLLPLTPFLQTYRDSSVDQAEAFFFLPIKGRPSQKEEGEKHLEIVSCTEYDEETMSVCLGDEIKGSKFLREKSLNAECVVALKPWGLPETSSF